MLVFILIGRYLVSTYAQDRSEDNPPGPATPPALTISIRTSSIPVGSEFEGEVVLNRTSQSPVQVRLTSSSPHSVAVSPSDLVISSGHRAATFLYRGDSAGTLVLSAEAAGYKTASLRINAEVVPAAATLRDAADSRALFMSAAADADELGFPSPLATESAYASTLARQYNMLEPENALKWIVVHPERDRYDFEPGDQLVAFAIAHHMKVRGHNLCWATTNPKWLDEYKTASSSAVAEILHHHIQAVMSHYRGKIFAWDVVNEAIDDRTSRDEIRLKDSIWYNQPGIGRSGTGYVEQAFRWAHEADPSALLFYNENNVEEPGRKFDAMYRMLADLLARGTPIHGVGIQAHISKNGFSNPEGLSLNIRRLTSLGLQVHLTEIDVPIRIDASGRGSQAQLARQAADYENLMKVCLRNPGCTGFQTWGFSDKHSWVPIYMPGMGAALPFDLNYQPKPAFQLLMKAMTGSSGRLPD